MATIRCPHCNLPLELKGVRPGRFTPKCTMCGQRFLMEISDDPRPKAYVSKIKKKPKPDAPAKERKERPASPRAQEPAPARPPEDEMTLASAPLRAAQPLESPELSEAIESLEPVALEETIAPSTPAARPEEITLASLPRQDDQPLIPADSDDLELALPPDLVGGIEAPEADVDDLPEEDMSIPAAEILDEPPSAAELTAPSLNRRPEKPTAAPAPDHAAMPGRTAHPDRPAAPTRPPAGDPNVTAPSARPAAEARPAAPLQAQQGDLSGMMGGYQIEKKLGEGGMGAVYLARQLSLDRNVAIKTMHPQWASDPLFLARFTREAYAAAQLNHHHVVQIHDIGQEGATPFFSMEFVKGQSLGELVKRDGRVDPEAAAGYILQAARGLKFAHDQGMIHRDIKPDNLMLNEQGIVKVADLGLVKTPGSKEDAAPASGKPGAPPAPRPTIAAAAGASVTMASAAMGTPAYMAPEQAVDAARVDARADIYSLGCTLYALVTGSAPFAGHTAMEVISKHATEAMTPPELIVQRLPKELSHIIQKMTAKKPADRYQTMEEVIKALETFLGVATTGPFTPKQEHAELLEENAAKFYNVPIARARGLVIVGFYLVCNALVLALALLHYPLLAGGMVGLQIFTAVFYQAIIGVVRKAYLFRKCRQLLFSSSLKDWLTYAAITAFVLLLLWATHLLWVWIGFCVVAAGLAAAFAFTIDRHLNEERRAPITHVEEMLKSMRLRGLEEEALRQFVCKYAGNRWELFYEALFGYEAKTHARELWGRGQADKNRPREGVWRDAVIRWIDQKMRLRKESKEKKVLQAVEEKSLRAKGVSAADAQQQAAQAAATMVSKAAEFKDAAAAGKAANLNARSFASGGGGGAETEEDAGKRRERSRTRVRSGPLVWLFGRKTRFALGALLLGGCVWWMNQNGIMSGQKAMSLAPTTQASTAAKAQEVGKRLNSLTAGTKPLELSGPLSMLKAPLKPVTDLFDGFSPGIAGLLLIVSAFFGRWPLGVIVIPAAAVIFVGHRYAGVPAVAGIPAAAVSALAGLVLAVLGFLFVRK